MNKNELVKRISEKTNLSNADATNALEAVTDAIIEAMKEGQKVELTGFGGFKVNVRAARTGRHPRTGEAINIPASKVVRFTVGKRLKDAVNV